MVKRSLTTLEQHLVERGYDQESRDLGRLLTAFALGSKVIAAELRRLPLGDLGRGTGERNVQNELAHQMDRFADQELMRCLGGSGLLDMIVSEERREPVVPREASGQHGYVALLDPLDGSSNLEVDLPVGSILGVYRRPLPQGSRPQVGHMRQPDEPLLLSAYVLYSSSTVLAYSMGHGVHVFTLEPTLGTYVLSREGVRMPTEARSYSCNEANASGFPGGVRRYIDWAKGAGHTLRYQGALVADFHRILLSGGLFLYPELPRQPRGKLRLQYECSPIAMLAEQAGGAASDGRRRILEAQGADPHARSPFYVGSRADVERLLGFLRSM